MIHPAKVDGWLAALLGGLTILEVGAGVSVLVAALATGDPLHQPGLIAGPVLLGCGVLLGLILRSLYRIRYEITATDLVICFGPFRSRLPLETIVEIFPTYNPLSAPAPSLDRLRINYRRKNGRRWFALVSPKDKEGFVRDLASAAPQLRRVPGHGPMWLQADGAL